MKTQHSLILIALTILFAAACKPEQKSDIEEKRAELAQQEKSLDELRLSISQLKSEIQELDTSAKANAIPVMVASLGKGSFKNAFQIQGLVESDQDVLVSAEVPSSIQSILVREGQRVSRGQAIATLDGSVMNSQIAELENALSLAKINYEKLDRLWQQNIGSEMQYLQAKNQYENLQKSLETSRQQLSKYTVRSPISGTIDELMVKQGELIGGLTSGPIARVVNLGDMKIKATPSERYLNQIKVGQSVEISIPSLGIKSKEKVTTVSRVVDPTNRTFTVTVKPRNLKGSISPNLLAMITAFDYTASDVIKVPTKLIRNDGSGDYIMVLKTNGSKQTVEKRMIEVEKKFSDESIVSKGLEAGDRIITEGYNNVLDGDEVKIIVE